MRTTIRKPRKTLSTSAEALAGVQVWLARIFGMRDVDMGRLDGEEQARLAELAAKARTEDHGVNLLVLDDRDRGRFERLVETASALPGHFADARADQKLRRDLDRLAELATRPAQERRLEQRGAAVLPRLVFEDLAGARLNVTDVALLALVAGLLSGGFRHPRARVTDGQLVYDAQMTSIGGPWDPDLELHGQKRSLDWLRESGWLAVARNGREVRVGRGDRWRAALADRDKESGS